MFIVAKKPFKFKLPDGSVYRVPKDFIGEVPERVAALPLFKLGLKDGSISAPESRKDKAVEKADADAAVKAAEVDIRPDAKPKKKAKAVKEAGNA